MALIPALLTLLQEGEGHAADTAAAAGEHASAGPFTINGGLILWTLLIFGILLLILAKTAWPAILKQIAYERRYELYMQGTRWEDTRRLGSGGNTVTFQFLPLPAAECRANPNAGC